MGRPRPLHVSRRAAGAGARRLLRDEVEGFCSAPCVSDNLSTRPYPYTSDPKTSPEMSAVALTKASSSHVTAKGDVRRLVLTRSPRVDGRSRPFDECRRLFRASAGSVGRDGDSLGCREAEQTGGRSDPQLSIDVGAMGLDRFVLMKRLAEISLVLLPTTTRRKISFSRRDSRVSGPSSLLGSRSTRRPAEMTGEMHIWSRNQMHSGRAQPVSNGS